MNQALKAVLTALQLSETETDEFCGDSLDIGLPHIFGGQLIGQAIFAARQTVHGLRALHSLHGYFLRPGDTSQPVTYRVERLRDGRNFSARRVCAIQNGSELFYMMASFQEPERGLEYQCTPLPIVPPEKLKNETQLALGMAARLPAFIRRRLLAEKALEIRPVRYHNPLKGEVAEAHRQSWIRAGTRLPAINGLQQALLGYASDISLLPTALQPHGLGLLEPGVIIASLDHAIWFHRPFDLADWLLYSTECTITTAGRAFVRGQFFDRKGVLVATTAQEGLLRHHAR